MTQPQRNIDLLIMYAGIFFISICTLPFVCQSLLFMVHVSAGKWLFPVIVVGTLVWCIGQLRVVLDAKTIAIWLTGITAITLIAAWLCLVMYDFSYDGMWYHQDGVRLIAAGWNPYTHFLSLKETSLSDLYLNHYPKATWISSGSIYAFTNKMESAKIINWFALYGAACFCYLTLKSVFSLSKGALIALTCILALNPVVIYQLFTFYVDGLMGSLLTCLICVAVLFHTQKIPARTAVYCAFIMMVFIVNIKFTSVIYVGLLALGSVAFVFLYKCSVWLKQAFILATIFSAGILVLGYPTYVRNTLTHGHPFYPIMGKGNIGEEVAKVTMPANFIGKNRFEQFNLATFARAEWSRAPNASRPKALFTTDAFTVLDEYKRADPEMSGFGPLFAEILLMVAAGLVAVFVLNRRQFNRYHILIVFTLAASVVIIPAFWYARYVPQLWTLVLLLSIVVAQQPKLRFFAYIVWVFAIINCGIVAQQNVIWCVKQTHALQKQFNTFKQQPKPPLIYDGWMHAFKIKLKENGVIYQTVLEKYPTDSITYIPNVTMTGAFYVTSSVKQDY
jgi:hypothetical protein